jgi:hypothetical protein
MHNVNALIQRVRFGVIVESIEFPLPEYAKTRVATILRRLEGAC